MNPTLKRVGPDHVLTFDSDTDMSHVVSLEDEATVLSFDSSLRCFDAKGETVAYLGSDRQSNWTVENNFGITVKPVSMELCEGVFDTEADFALQWLNLVYLPSLNTSQKS